MKFLAHDWFKKTGMINRRTVQLVVLVITLLLFALGAGAPLDVIGGGGM